MLFRKGKHLISSHTHKSSNAVFEELNLKVSSVIYQAWEAGKNVFESELQLIIIWLKLSSTPPVIINTEREVEKYLQPRYIIANKVHLLFNVLSYNNSSYIYHGLRIFPVVDECVAAFIKKCFSLRVFCHLSRLYT